MVEIRQGDRKAAFEVPFKAYGAEHPYVSPMRMDVDRILDPERNPLCQDGRGRLQLFTAHRNGAAIGRIVASVHTASNVRHGTNMGQFGFFDYVNNPEVAAELLRAAEAWLIEQGVDEAVGNFNLTAMQMIGVVTEGFENSPYTDMMWSPPWLPEHLRMNGYASEFPMTTFETDITALDPDIFLGSEQKDILSDPDFTWHPINMRTFKQRMEDARQVLNDGFSDNPMFVPLSQEEYQFQAGEMMWVMDPRLSTVIHHKGCPAGVIVCIPDLNPFVKATGSKLSWLSPYHYLHFRLRRDRAVIIYYSVKRELHGHGINGAMLHRVVSAAKQAGYRMLGGTWISDENTASLKQMRGVGSTPLHRLHLFRKRLRPAT
ncbi:MAG: GNAT family N-acetyltransferase [Pseudomonadota bacterium]